MSPEEILARLRVEIARTDAHTEQECGSLLKEIAWVLLSRADGNVTFLSSEQIVSTGRTDIVVLADSIQLGGSPRRDAYIWELKAPQLKLFDVKTRSQAQPTPDLYSAETQLMHYCYAVSNDGTLLRRWGVLTHDHVRLGGVIIGRENDFFNMNGEDLNLGKQLACEAMEVRELYFYRRLNINLWTWDKVVSLAEIKLSSHLKYVGDPNIQIDSTGIAESSATITASR